MAGAQALLAVPVAAAMAAAIVGAGSRARLWLRVPLEPGLLLPAAWSLGSLLIGAAVLLLGVLRLWSPWTLSGVVAAGIVLGPWRRSIGRYRDLVPGVLGALFTLPIALAQPFFYDALVYHLALPWQGLLEGGLCPHPEDLFAAFPPLAQLLYAPALAVGVGRAPALIHFSGFVVASAAVGALARALGAPRWAAFLAGVCLPLLPCSVLVPGLPAAEGWLVSGVVLAAALVVQRRWSPATGVLVGLTLGLGSTARLQGLALAAILVACVLVRSRSLRSAASSAIGWLAGSCLWWGKNLLLLRDPAAPVFAAGEGVDTLWRDAGSTMHSVGGAVSFAHATLAALLPHVSYLAPLLLAALIAVVARPAGRQRLIAGAALAGVLAWGLTGNLPRFLLPVIGLGLALAASSAGRSTAGRWAAALALGTTAAIGLALTVFQVERFGGVRLPLRERTADGAPLVVNDPWPAFTAASSTLPADARVLFVGEPRGFGFPRRFVAPSQHDVSPLRSMLESARAPADAAAALRRAGFTHLLVNFGELARLAGGYPVAPWRDAAGLARWNAFLRSLGFPLVERGGVAIYAVP